MQEKQPKPPRHLASSTRKWWALVVETYDLEPHHVRILTLAAESWDRTQQARKALDKHGLTYTDGAGRPRARPEVNIERDSRIAYCRCLRELALDIEPPADDVRPPRIMSGNSGRRAM